MQHFSVGSHVRMTIYGSSSNTRYELRSTEVQVANSLCSDIRDFIPNNILFKRAQLTESSVFVLSSSRVDGQTGVMVYKFDEPLPFHLLESLPR